MHLAAWTPWCVALAALAALPSSTAAASSKNSKNAILLSKVQSLTLRAGKMTTHRRVAAVPQLSCTANPQRLCDLFTVDTMRCTNQGSGYDAEDIQWSCTASLPPEFKLGSTDVVCEGYSSADDPYVLKGSCAVEYRLVLTDFGERQYPDLAGEARKTSWGADKTFNWVFWCIFVAIALWILWAMFMGDGARDRGDRNNRPGGGFWGGGGGGGGGDGPGFGPDNDPPPPYPGTKQWGGQQQQQGWRPGFWTGAATGATAAYLASTRNNRNNRDNSSGYYGDQYGGGRRGGSTWGGSGGAGPSSSSSSVSSARQPSTGFGGTQRR
ncbi:uncharacterized protein SPSK_05405 [Sporothrix schenckii 1099-18]|uniref:Store-operated calcium entry-associated regulatory factor n=1 Tax=Sporothrix schenckii 1099-18 TaxID=1397361 RepID=A0A0F2LY13_SPOSC|nr:uncharacterized protein SPSK_05405 [Sporothrix schenckii 1099-18]KJR80786.1 hypothetical protein SPSK_05405 [Sporothrix schenckii 1099-18]